MVKHTKKPRKKSKGRFVNLPFFLLRSEAWLALTSAQCCIYIALSMKYNGSNNGQLAFSCRDAAKACSIHKDTAAKGFKRLEELGFIKIRMLGSFSVKRRLATEYEITQFPFNNNLAAKTFMKWRPEKEKTTVGKKGTYSLNNRPNVEVSLTNDAVM